MSFKNRYLSQRSTAALLLGLLVLLMAVAVAVLDTSTDPVPRLAPKQRTNQGGTTNQNQKEYWEAKGALLWLPTIKWVVDEGIREGVIQLSERALFENMILGVVGVEAGGANPFIKRTHGLPGAVSSDGLTQLIRLHLWSNENPFDPLTNLRAGVRTLARYYRGYGNRWDLALMEHLTGDVTNPDKIDDAGFMNGRSYPRRVIEINKTARRLLEAGDLWDDPYYFVRNVDDLTRQGMSLAPPWNIFDSPNLPFNWTPPPTSRAYELWAGAPTDIAYYQKAVDKGIQVRLGNADDPGEDKPGPSIGDAAVMFESVEAPVFNPRPATPQERAALQSRPEAPAVKGVNYLIGRFRPAPIAQSQ